MTALEQLLALYPQAPPMLAWALNPAYTDWQQQVAGLTTAAADADAALLGPLGTMNDAQIAYDLELGQDVSPTIERQGRVLTNPDYAPWQKRVEALALQLAAAKKTYAGLHDVAVTAHKALTSAAAAPPPHEAVFDNPQRTAWQASVDGLMATLRALQPTTVYDADAAQARAAVAHAHDVAAALTTRVEVLQASLQQQQALVAQWPLMLDSLQVRLVMHRARADAAASDVGAGHNLLDTIRNRQPLATMTVPNPAFDTWQQQMPPLQQELDAATARVTVAQGPCVDAQAACDAKGQQEPEPTIERNGHVRPNPEHTRWQAEMAALQAILDAASATLFAAQRTRDAAQAAFDEAARAAPAPTITVDNPEYATWQQQCTTIQQQIDAAQTELDHANAAVTETNAQITDGNARLQLAHALIASLPAEIAALASQFAAAQHELAQLSLELARIERQIAVVGGATADDATIVDVTFELQYRWQAAQSALHDVVDAADAADDTAWYLRNRADELTRAIVEVDAALVRLTAAEGTWQTAAGAVVAFEMTTPEDDL